MGPSLGFTQAFSYLIDQEKILLSKGGDGTLNLYLDGQGIDEHLGEVSRNGTHAFLTDHLGSVLNSSISGSFQSYDAYGRTIAGLPLFASILPSDPVNYGFAGRQFDIESGKYYNRARMYDPNTGRFMSQDPIGLEAGDTNLYRYAFNNPLMYLDPTGKVAIVDDLLEITLGVATVGAAVGVASALSTLAAGGSGTQAIQAFESGFISGATSALAAVLTATTGSTLLATAAAAAVDLAFSFLSAPTAIPTGGGTNFLNGIQVQVQVGCP